MKETLHLIANVVGSNSANYVNTEFPSAGSSRFALSASHFYVFQIALVLQMLFFTSKVKVWIDFAVVKPPVSKSLAYASSSFFFLSASRPIVKFATGAIHVAASIPSSSSRPGSFANASIFATSAASPSR